ncbi:MAG: BlaI/MecI/CopY family transcriptional regulator [Acidobacteriia bacterium]|nr:BlaI/MecI/CopY family transcriptional regulator [Terriglobia bacterium]
MARAAAQRELPPPLELSCLKALWSLGEGSVNDVRRIVSRNKPLAYTTVMTLLDRLARKGVVTRRKMGRAFLYTPQVSQDSVRRMAVREFLENHFDGSADVLIEFLGGVPAGLSVAAAAEPARAAAAASDGRLDTALL